MYLSIKWMYDYIMTLKTIYEIQEYIKRMWFIIEEYKESYNKKWLLNETIRYYDRENYTWDLKFDNFDKIRIILKQDIIELDEWNTIKWKSKIKCDEKIIIEIKNIKLFTWNVLEEYSLIK